MTMIIAFLCMIMNSCTDESLAPERTSSIGNDALRDTRDVSVQPLATANVRGTFAGGPLYKSGYAANITELRNSGLTTVIIWTIHIDASGNLNLNAEFPICSSGTYTGNSTYPNFPASVALLKTAPTSIDRIEICVLGYNATGSFASIKSLIASQGTGTTSILYRNFNALKQAIPQITAVNFDDEATYDNASSKAFALMLGDLGYQVTMCPYTNSSYWNTLVSQINTTRPGLVDRIYLQCYAGGASNNPCSWNVGGVPIYPGLWGGTTHMSASQVQSKLATWNSCLSGGWIWLYDDIIGSMASYNTAIVNGVGGGTVPGAAANPSPANNATGVSTTATLSWTAGSNATSHDVYFGTTSSPALIGNQTGASYTPGTLAANTVYYWRINEKNTSGTTTGPLWTFTTGAVASGTDITNLSGTVSAQYTDSPAGEDIAKLIDNSTGTKYLTFHSSGWVQFRPATGAAVVKYTITSANDSPERDPKNWTLQGSNNGTSWTTLNTQTNQTFASRFLTKTYTFSNTTSYTYYRLNVSAVGSGTIMQMAEWELWKN